MIIGGREIGAAHPPAVIAELGGNHGGDLERAMKLIDAAKDAGADFVKFQCFTPDGITLDSDRPEFQIADGPWKGRRLYDLYTKTATPLSWYPALFERAQQRGIGAFASVFSPADVDFLEQLGCPAYKIASFEIVDLPLIRYAAETGKPLIISTGMASENEINSAIGAAFDGGLFYDNIALLRCVSAYPTPIAEANLWRLNKPWTPTLIGVSDHTTGIEIPVAATALGACIIEKHMMLDKRPTEDSEFSLTPTDFRRMVNAVRNTWSAMQQTFATSEASSRQMRRSLFVVQDIAMGEEFTSSNVRSIRPSDGMPPREIDNVIGKRAARDIERGEPLKWEMIA